MAGITVLADDVATLANVLASVEGEFTAAGQTLRDLRPEEVGPPDVGQAVTEVLARLERRLSGLAVEAGDGVRAVRRHVGDLPTAEPTGPVAEGPVVEGRLTKGEP